MSRSRPLRQDRQYWDTMADRWDDEIFNTLHHDKNRVIPEEIRRSSRNASSVADFGCGVGIYFPLLSQSFEVVHGFERSLACVAIARDKYREMANVAVHSASSASVGRYGRFDVVLCVNVAIHPSPRERVSVLAAVNTLLGPGGTLVLVVPSFESATMVAAAEATAPARGSRTGSGDWKAAADSDGGVSIEGVRTKHYTRQELGEAAASIGLSIKRVRRVEYSWRSQGVRPGAKFRGTSPWDWIVVASR